MADSLARSKSTTGGCPFHHGSTNDPKALRDSIAQVAERERELREAFYSRLFGRFPAVKERFGAYSRNQQAQMMNQIIEAVYDSVDEDTSWLKDHLASLGSQHADWEVTEPMYRQLEDCLVEALAEILGTDWSPDLERTWRDRLRWVADAMLGRQDATHGDLAETDEPTAELPLDPPTAETVERWVRMFLRMTLKWYWMPSRFLGWSWGWSSTGSAVSRVSDVF